MLADVFANRVGIHPFGADPEGQLRLDQHAFPRGSSNSGCHNAASPTSQSSVHLWMSPRQFAVSQARIS
jgi:hypothetical protein